MSKISFENTKSVGFFAKKGFYIALAACLVAIGAATWTAVNTFSPGEDNITLDITSPIDVSESVSLPGVMSEDTSAAEENRPVDVQPESPPPASQPDASEDTAAVQAEPERPPTFVMPVEGEIIKEFSDTRLQFSTTFNDWRIHQGIDIKSSIGSAIVAVTDGVVREVRNDPLWGTTIVIEHAGGITGYYSGLNPDVLVQVGDIVSGSEKIGALYIVPAEEMDGPHLHFGVKRDGRWVCPLEAMGMAMDN